MAGEVQDDGSIAIQVDDLESVVVDVGQQAAPEGDKTGKTKEPKQPRTRRVSPELSEDGSVQVAGQQQEPEPSGPSPEEALKQAQEHARAQEEARKAAEATAAAERAQRLAAERAREQAQNEAAEQAQRADDTQLTLIESNIAAAQRELDDQRDAYTRAAEAGEFSKMADIQIKISKAAAALDRWEDTKANVESQRRTQPATEGRVTATTQPSSEVEQFLSGFAPHAQTWLRQHMDCLPAQYGGNAAKNNQMMAGHYEAVARGLAEGSDAYFKVIEEKIGARQPEPAPAPAPVASRAAEVVPAAAPRAAPLPAAPVSRDAPAASGAPQPRSAREVRLTKDQQEMAKLSFPNMTEQQAYGAYARNLLELEAEGKLGRSTH